MIGVDERGEVDDPSAASDVSLLLVPAWDFGADGWSHSRLAVLRGIENGVSVEGAVGVAGLLRRGITLSIHLSPFIDKDTTRNLG